MSIHKLFNPPSLRGYQLNGIGGCRSRLGRGKKVILCMGTGSGKTYTASEIIRLCRNRGTKVTILCHRYEIMIQFLESLAKFGVEPNVLYKDQRIVGQINLSMVQTYSRRYPNGLDEDLIVMDECHIGNFYKTLTNTSAQVLGLTATPISSKQGYNMHEVFDDIVTPISVPELIDAGNLVKGITYSVEHDFSHIKRKGGDFDTDELVNEFRKTPKLFGGALENYTKYALGRKAFCFSVNVSQSKEQCELFNKAGIISEHVDGDTPDGERKKIFNRFEYGSTQVLHNVNIATAGTDIPAVGCVIENFATQSLAKHHQCIGRGSRPFEGKEDFVIIDLGKNYARHGIYGDDVDWVKIFKNPKLDTNKKENALKMPCPECGAILTIPKHDECGGFESVECPYCNNTLDEKEVKEKNLEMMTAEEIKEFKKAGMPEEIRGIPISRLTNEQLVLYGIHMGHSPKWAQIRTAKRRRW